MFPLLLLPLTAFCCGQPAHARTYNSHFEQLVVRLFHRRRDYTAQTKGLTELPFMPRQSSHVASGKRPKRSNPKRIISRARDVMRPFEELDLPSTLPYSSLANLQLRHVTGPMLTEEESIWMISSIETSLRHLYDSSQMKWDRQEKLKDMHHIDQRFLFVSHKELGGQVAFLSFRWDLEENEPIMYVYELFVEPRARGNGLAIALMRYAEDFCRKLHVHRLMLTVFCENQAAMRLYRQRLGYDIDDDSPSKYGIEDAGYEILSKRLPNADGS